jgi:hypothetical protein
MEALQWVSIIALSVSAVAALAATLLHLANETRKVPKRQRLTAVAQVVRQGIRRCLPSRQSLAVWAASIGGFLAVGLPCAAVCWLWLLQPSTRSDDENVAAGAAAAALNGIYAVMGLAASFALGLASGVAVGCYVNGRLSHCAQSPRE